MRLRVSLYFTTLLPATFTYQSITLYLSFPPLDYVHLDSVRAENRIFELSCNGGGVIQSIDFASFGLPRHDCVAPETSDCHSPLSQKHPLIFRNTIFAHRFRIVEERCLGKESCRFAVRSSDFIGTEMCGDVSHAKSLFVTARCSQATPSALFKHILLLSLIRFHYFVEAVAQFLSFLAQRHHSGQLCRGCIFTSLFLFSSSLFLFSFAPSPFAQLHSSKIAVSKLALSSPVITESGVTIWQKYCFFRFSYSTHILLLLLLPVPSGQFTPTSGITKATDIGSAVVFSAGTSSLPRPEHRSISPRLWPVLLQRHWHVRLDGLRRDRICT